MTEKEIKKLVKSITEQQGTREPFELCRRLDVELCYTLLTSRVRAFYQQLYGVDVIYLSDSLNETEQKIVLSHELGHCLLHKGLNSFFITRSTLLPVSKYEREADIFARELLSCLELDLRNVDSEIAKILLG